MKITRIIISVMLLGLLSACNQSASTLKDIKGNVIKLSEHRGKWLIINYWASWCKPCYQEVPALNAFYRDNKDKAVVVGVSYDREQGQALEKIIAKVGVKFPTLAIDPADMFGLGNIPGLPATYIIAPNGKLKQRLLGMQTEKSLAEAIS